MKVKVFGGGIFLLAALSRVLRVTSQVFESHNLRRVLDQSEDVDEAQSHRRLGCKSRPLPKFDRGVKPETVVSWVALGDTPYTLRDRYCLNHQLRNIDLSKPNGPKFAVHVGDIKESGVKIPCDERLYSDVSDIFTHPANSVNYDSRNLFFVVGDNESADCWRPDDAWQLWMKYFGPNNKDGFGTFSDGVKVHRQTSIDGMDRSENFSFYVNNILFVGLNIIGGRERGDENVRLAQNFKWVRNQMSYYSSRGMKAVVIMAHGVLKPGGFHYTYFANDLFALLRKNYKKLPVLYLHGDGHDYCVRYPAPDLNYVDMMVDEGGYANPIIVSVLRDPATDEHIFSVDRRGGLYSPGASSDDIPDCPIIEKVTWNVTLPASNQLVWRGLNPSKSLKACQGNCKNDKSCGPGLKCMTRTLFEPVPGCTGKGKKGKNYCYDETYNNPKPSPKPTPTPAAPPTSAPTKSTPPDALKLVGPPPHKPNSLGLCQGNCLTDADCEGNLSCFRRSNFTPVPGCTGSGKKHKNYCYKPDPKPTPAAPPTPTATPTVAPVNPQPTSSPKELTIDGFPPHAPDSLDRCEGHCKSDMDCKADLYCHRRKSFQPVPGCSGRGKSGRNYCAKREAGAQQRL